MRERPSVNHRRAIYAPVSRKTPYLLWIEITPNAPGWDGHDEPRLDELLKLQPGESGYIGRHTTYIRGNVLRDRKENDHIIELCQRDDDRGPDPPINQSLNAVDGHAWSTWRGPVIIMAKAGTEFDPASYIDVSLNDFRDAADYIYYFREGIGSATDGIGSEAHWGKLISGQYGGKAQVVRVACRGEQSANGVPEFSSVEIPKTHPAFRLADDPPSISEVLSESVSVFKEKPPANMYGSEAVASALDNPSISDLYCNVGHTWSAETARLGTVQDGWSQEVGTVLVLRRDKRAVTLDWIKALCELCRTKAIPWANACRDSEGTIDQLHSRIQKEIAPLLLS